MEFHGFLHEKMKPDLDKIEKTIRALELKVNDYKEVYDYISKSKLISSESKTIKKKSWVSISENCYLKAKL